MINAVSLFTVTAYIVNVKILGVLWIGSAASVSVLLIISSVSKIAEKKNYDTNSKYYTPEYNFPQKLPFNIWSRILTSALKIQKIFCSRKIIPQVPQHYETTDNHSFHNDTPSQKQPNANKTQLIGSTSISVKL